ncbi:type II toxin-antitoxin system VapC family toxin [Anaerolineales bacterium HSG6]|nr:type II toxin-antitoxin system VapC family toxin [Anaerolineales bacterium HSG6]
MSVYLLDTNHLSPLVTPGHPMRKRVLERLDAGDTFSTYVPVLVETLYGIGILPRAKQNLLEWERLESNFYCHIPDEIDAKKAARLRVLLRKQGWQLEAIDALIAIVALRYNLTLLTIDKDFPDANGIFGRARLQQIWGFNG